MGNTKSDLGRILKQRRVMVPMTLYELGHAADVSPSHLGRIERGERFPSARILRRLAKPLGMEEAELLTLAEYMSPETSFHSCDHPQVSRVDPYVAAVLSEEPLEIQRAIIGILSVTKSIARSLRASEERSDKLGNTDKSKNILRSRDDGTDRTA